MNRTAAPDPGCSAPSSHAPAEIRISTTESLFGSHFKQLLQQNRPIAVDLPPLPYWQLTAEKQTPVLSRISSELWISLRWCCDLSHLLPAVRPKDLRQKNKSYSP